MRQWASGVTIVTSHHAGIRQGMTVSSFTSLTLNPPLVLVSLEQGKETYELVERSRVYGVSILNSQQADLSDRFAGRLPEVEDRFKGVEVFTLVTGAPLLKDSLANFDCRVLEMYPSGSHTIFIGLVVATRIGRDGKPLIYYKQAYHTTAV